MTRGNDIYSIDSIIRESGESDTLIAMPSQSVQRLADLVSAIEIAQQDDLNLASNMANARWMLDLQDVRDVVEVIAYAQELSSAISDAELGVPLSVVNSVESVIFASSIANPKSYWCVVPAATLGAIAAAININMGATGSMGCLVACATTTGCISLGVLAANPTCFGAAAGCGAYGAVGLGEVVQACRSYFFSIMK